MKKKRGRNIRPAAPPVEVVPSGQPPGRGNHTITTLTAYAGPLPDPQMLAEYDRVVPGAAERIITRFEQQGLHRQKLEQEVVTHGNRNELVGTLMGGALALAALAVSGYLAALGYPWPGVVGVISTVSGLVYTVRTGRQATQKEMQSKREILRGKKGGQR